MTTTDTSAEIAARLIVDARQAHQIIVDVKRGMTEPLQSYVRLEVATDAFQEFYGRLHNEQKSLLSELREAREGRDAAHSAGFAEGIEAGIALCRPYEKDITHYADYPMSMTTTRTAAEIEAGLRALTPKENSLNCIHMTAEMAENCATCNPARNTPHDGLKDNSNDSI